MNTDDKEVVSLTAFTFRGVRAVQNKVLKVRGPICVHLRFSG